ncbi:MAG: hypothetical protein ACOVSW_23800 [Candidatus Kapaibacteriota bacterium]
MRKLPIKRGFVGYVDLVRRTDGDSLVRFGSCVWVSSDGEEEPPDGEEAAGWRVLCGVVYRVKEGAVSPSGAFLSVRRVRVPQITTHTFPYADKAQPSLNLAHRRHG